MKVAVLEAPSILGLWPSGVENAPMALLEEHLLERIGGRHAGVVLPPAYNPKRDPFTGMLNPHGIRQYSIDLAAAVRGIFEAGEFPLVLGGDCSILLGPMLALRRRARCGLLFLDGHSDFYPPHKSHSGEAADMDLGLVAGRGPAIVADIEGLRPLVREEDVVAFGPRDDAAAEADGVPSLAGTGVQAYELAKIRQMGFENASSEAVGMLASAPTLGFWIHFDVDVLDDAEMPAVDYRQPRGLRFAEAEMVLHAASATGRALGMTLTIFNPRLDADLSLGRKLVQCLGRVLNARERSWGPDCAF